jgi:hypothetical protein
MPGGIHPDVRAPHRAVFRRTQHKAGDVPALPGHRPRRAGLRERLRDLRGSCRILLVARRQQRAAEAMGPMPCRQQRPRGRNVVGLERAHLRT